MIYIANDLRPTGGNLRRGHIIEYHQVMSRRTIRTNEGAWCTLKLYDVVSKKYKKQRVWIVPVRDELQRPIKNVFNVTIYKHQIYEGEK